MNKESFIKMVKSGGYDIQIFFDYYNEFNTNESFKYSFDEFCFLFNQFQSIYGLNIFNNVIKYYIMKYNILIVLDENGNILNYV